MQRPVELAGDEGLDAALPDRQLLLPGDLVVVARAAVAEDAALAVERDVLGERDRLLEVQAGAVGPGRAGPPPGSGGLQRALPPPFAQGALPRVVCWPQRPRARAR